MSDNKPKRKRDIEYVTPTPDQKMRARDVVDIYWHLLGYKCAPVINRILSRLIWHTSIKDGQCDPSQDTLGLATGYARSKVNLAIKWAKEEGFVTPENPERHRSAGYHLNWPFFDFLHNIATGIVHLRLTGSPELDHEDAKAAIQHGLRVAPTKGTEATEIVPTLGAGVVPTVGTTVVPTVETGVVPNTGTTEDRREDGREDGIEDGREAASPPNLQEKVSLELTPFMEDWLSPESLEAATAAELATPGSGRAVAARLANDAWKKSRNIKGGSGE